MYIWHGFFSATKAMKSDRQTKKKKKSWKRVSKIRAQTENVSGKIINVTVTSLLFRIQQMVFIHRIDTIKILGDAK